MNCRVCSNSLFVGRDIFLVPVAGFYPCPPLGKRVMAVHQPPFGIGAVALGDKSVPREVKATQNKVSADKKQTEPG